MNIHDRLAKTRHCQLHCGDSKWSDRQFLRFEIIDESDKIAVFSDISAISNRKRRQVALNVDDVFDIQRKGLIERRLEIGTRATRGIFGEESVDESPHATRATSTIGPSNEQV